MPVNIATIPLGPIDTNCYLVSDPVQKTGFVIDPAPECEPLLKAIAGLSISDILLTHAHFDHIGGATRVAEATGARIWVHGAEADWLTSPVRNLSVMAGVCGPIAVKEADVLLQGGETFKLLGQELHVQHTPGHTPGHVTYVFGAVAFVGDLIFREGVGRTDFPGGDFATLQKSIADVIMRLSGSTTLYPGHGPATTVDYERRHNPYLIRP